MDKEKVKNEVEDTSKKVTNDAPKSCKGKKLALKISIITAVVAVLAVGAFFGYKLLMGKKPVKVTSSAIRGLKESIASVKDNNSEIVKIIEGDDAFEIESTIKVTLPDNNNPYLMNLLAQLDKEAGKGKFDISATEGKLNKLVDLSALIDGDKAYFKLNDTMDNYYFSKFEEAVESFDPTQLPNLPEYDYENIIDYLADAFENAISDKDFKKTKEEITIKDKDIKVSKYTATIDENKLKGIADKFMDKVLADKDLLKVISELTGEDVDTIKEGIKEFKALKASDLGKVSFEYSVYVTSMGKAIGYGFGYENVEFIIANKDDVTSFQANIQGMPIVLEFEKKSDNHVVATANFMGIINGELDVTSKLTTVSKGKEYKEDVDITFTISAMGQSAKASASISSTIKKIDSVDTSAKVGAIDIDSLDSAGQNKLLNQITKSSTYKFIQSLSEGFESSSLIEEPTSVNY